MLSSCGGGGLVKLIKPVFFGTKSPGVGKLFAFHSFIIIFRAASLEKKKRSSVPIEEGIRFAPTSLPSCSYRVATIAIGSKNFHYCVPVDSWSSCSLVVVDLLILFEFHFGRPIAVLLEASTRSVWTWVSACNSVLLWPSNAMSRRSKPTGTESAAAPS